MGCCADRGAASLVCTPCRASRGWGEPSLAPQLGGGAHCTPTPQGRCVLLSHAKPHRCWASFRDRPQGLTEPPSAPGLLPSLLPSPWINSAMHLPSGAGPTPLFLPPGQTNALFTITHPSCPKPAPLTSSSLPSDSCPPSPQLGSPVAPGPWALHSARFPKSRAGG